MMAPRSRWLPTMPIVAMLGAMLVALACGEQKTSAVPARPSGPTPDSFRVAFTTTRGPFAVEAYRLWAPRGVDRFYELVSSGLLDDNAFFRVVPKFIVQFGAFGDPAINAHWDSLRIADDPPGERNRRGTLTFAQDGRDSRTHQLFVNLADNANLDGKGFVPIGRVVEGMDVVDSIYAMYRERPEYHLIATLGNPYLRRMFPRLDFITAARVIR
jgi:cyclophilin family peptidyl-prolyl cis-trans isomerase